MKVLPSQPLSCAVSLIVSFVGTIPLVYPIPVSETVAGTNYEPVPDAARPTEPHSTDVHAQ